MFVVTFDGRLASDADFRFTQSGQPHADFNVITNRTNPSTGENVTQSVRCTYWGNKESLVPHLTKGRQLFITGELRLSSWSKDGRHGVNADCNVFQLSFGQTPQNGTR